MNKKSFFPKFLSPKKIFFLNQKAVPNFKSENFKQCLEKKELKMHWNKSLTEKKRSVL
jgi:hypothetical protein